MWRPSKKGKHLTVSVTTFRDLTKPEGSSLEDAAGRPAPFRGGTDTVVSVT
jgi:hypothetical protein